MIALYAQLVVIFATVLVIGMLLLLLAPALEHYRWSRRNRRRIGWYS
jgi:hypothetical protein